MRELKDSKSLIYFATSAQNNTKSRADGEKTMENGALKGAERAQNENGEFSLNITIVCCQTKLRTKGEN